MAALSSVESDLRSILWIQALRAFVYGFGVVVLGTALARSGLSDAAVTLVFTAMLAGMALASIVVGWIGDRLERRWLYAILLAVMGATGVVIALSESLWVLCVVALTGTMSTDANESGPITSLEQAMMGQAPGLPASTSSGDTTPWPTWRARWARSQRAGRRSCAACGAHRPAASDGC